MLRCLIKWITQEQTRKMKEEINDRETNDKIETE